MSGVNGGLPPEDRNPEVEKGLSEPQRDFIAAIEEVKNSLGKAWSELDGEEGSAGGGEHFVSIAMQALDGMQEAERNHVYLTQVWGSRNEPESEDHSIGIEISDEPEAQ